MEKNMARVQATEKKYEAIGHLMAAADEAEKLMGLLTSMQQIVRLRIDRADLISGPMAETIETLAEKIVADIWLAVRANDAASDSSKA